MKGLVYRKSIPRYAALRYLGPRLRGLYTSGVSPVRLAELPEPALPTQEWVRVRPQLSGICGSDVATLTAKGSPYLAPITSMPFVLGHELVGVIEEVGDAAGEFASGQRVVVQPALGCRVRGIDPPCPACATGQDALCSNVARGDISPGIQTGYCRDTGGGWSRSLVAHRSQIYLVPDEMPDNVAVLVEPFACAVHGALRAMPGPDQTVLVVGAGAIGLLTIAALRAMGCTSRMLVVAKHDHQKEHATRLGATELLPAGGKIIERYKVWANALSCDVLQAEIGKPTVIGGADVTFDCVASSTSIDDSLRFTRGGGTVVLVGMPGIPSGVDFTPLWFKELTVRAAYAYGTEQRDGGDRTTFDISIDLLRTWGQKLTPLLAGPYPLADYRVAFESAIHTGRSGAVKTLFAID